MLQYTKAFGHKGIDEIEIRDLGHLNIVCGKNNSGKSSLLEALSNTNTFKVGRKIDDIDYLVSIFEKQFTQYAARDSIRKFIKENLKKLAYEGFVCYLDELLKLGDFLDNEIAKNPPRIQFDYFSILNEFLRNTISKYKPVLIPAKRLLNTQININLNEALVADGRGVINKLFYLKNQDLKSNDYKIYQKIYEAFYEISNCRFNIFPDAQNQLTLHFQINNTDWLKASDCGLGLLDLLVLLTVILATDYNFYMIEEPENHMHADCQKRFLSILRKIKSKQFLISTHSNVFIDTNLVDNIIYVFYDGNVQISDQTSKSKIINTLGYSTLENLVADAIILTEGPSDIPVIRKIVEWLGVNEQYNIRYWCLGGDIMAELDLSIFAERHNVFAIIDNDPRSSVIRTRFQTRCKTNGVTCFRLKRYAIENYFKIDAVRKIFPKLIPKNLQEFDYHNSVSSQLTDHEKSIKGKNHEIILNMNLMDLEGTDLLENLKTIKKFLERK